MQIVLVNKLKSKNKNVTMSERVQFPNVLFESVNGRGKNHTMVERKLNAEQHESHKIQKVNTTPSVHHSGCFL